jgi:hypothetical protein
MWSNETFPAVEDCIEFHIYDLIETGDLISNCSLYNNFAKNIILDHIWQDENFEIQVDGTHLSGSTRFGDNIEDEWFIVYILWSLSKEFPSLLISMQDSDGDFLLIEGSLTIPKWLSPENSENRVWLNNGKFHIIPKARTPMELLILPSENNLSLDKALHIMRNERDKINTVVDTETQKTLEARLQSGHKSAVESLHVAECYLPRSLGYLLTNFPSLVGPAVRAYYHRDPIQTRGCKTLMRFKDVEALQLTRVKFSRVLFAQILRQPLELLPRGLESLPKEEKNPVEYKRYSIGYKLLCGFEIFYKDQMQRKNKKQSNKQTKSKSKTDEINISSGDSLNFLELIEDIMDRELYASFEPPHSLPVSSEEWLNISPEEVNDIIAEKQRELDLYLLRKNQQKTENKKEGKETKIANEQIPLTQTEKSNEKKTKSSGKLEHLIGEDDNPIDQLAGCLKKFVKESSNIDGIKGKASERRERRDSSTETSSEDESDEFYRMGDDSDDGAELDSELVELMKMMDRDLENSCLTQSFEKKQKKTTQDKGKEKPSAGVKKDERGDDTEESDEEVDVDFNLVKNFLASYSEQYGLPGPVSNLFHQLNIGK